MSENEKKTNPIELTITMKNCFGIRSLNHTFQFDDAHNVSLIYASNGVMKTSFTKTLEAVQLINDGIYIFSEDGNLYANRVDLKDGKGGQDIPIEEFDNIFKGISFNDIKINDNKYNEVKETIKFLCLHKNPKLITYSELRNVYGINNISQEDGQKYLNEFYDYFPKMPKYRFTENYLAMNQNKEIVETVTNEHGEEEKIEDVISKLSEGELKIFLFHIFFIRLQIIGNKHTHYLVLDDIVDSFDYGNKHAIIEYLIYLAEKKRENTNQPRFYLILLTHNYDFYRSVYSQLKKHCKGYIATKNNDAEITIEPTKYIENFFKEFILKNISITKLAENEYHKNLIAAIPFARNLAEYQEDKDSKKVLTQLLHIKKKTKDITLSELISHIKKVLPNHNLSSNNENKKALDVIYHVADSITSTEAIAFEQIIDKLVLAIAIRLKTEEFILKELKEKKSLKNNQIKKISATTRTLVKGYRKEFSDHHQILRKVLIITPEFIHINAFMYEPLIDTPIDILVNLYQEIKNLNNEKEAKA